MDGAIQLKLITNLTDITKMQQLQQAIWEETAVVPDHQLLTAAKNGGILIGAYHEDEMVGMLYSFPGFLCKHAYLCSHMMGIKNEWRSKGIGEQLKLAQAEFAASAGYELITWTYDPLEAANAYLNIHKLGALSRTYIVNCYGEMTDKLNAGLPSDRLQVEWWLNNKLPVRPQAKGEAVPALTWREASARLAEPVDTNRQLAGAGVVTVAVPANFQYLKAQAFTLAQEWRLAVRIAMTNCFAAGLIISDYRALPGQPVNEYILVPAHTLPLPSAPWLNGGENK